MHLRPSRLTQNQTYYEIFRLYSHDKDWALSAHFPYKMVLENNVDNQTFGDAIEHMENTIKEPNRAFLSYKDYVLNDEKHKCKVKIFHWKSL